MMSYKVYYDYFDGVKAPIWFVVDADLINWDDDTYSVFIQAPFDLYHADDFDQYDLNVSITMNELTLNSKMQHIGINLRLLKIRLDEHAINYSNVSNFIIQVADIEEILTFSLGD